MECEGIRLIRDLVETLDSDLQFAKCLSICAPHTHWGNQIIVETFDPDHAIFLNGPKSAQTARPFSFVFTQDGPAPFEWMDETVDIDPVDLTEAYAFIARLGVSIDHRFKQSIFDEQLFGYVEGYHMEQDGRAVVSPVLESVVNPENRNSDQVQVTWSCFPNSYYPSLELTESERRVLLQLEAVLASISPSEAVEFVSGLQSVLQEQVERGSESVSHERDQR
jgi:hypothetical protein